MYCSLFQCQEAHALDVSVVSVASDDIVRKESLNSVVELVLIGDSRHLLEERVHPVGVFSAISELVVLDHIKPFSQDINVKRWVQGVLGWVESVQGLFISSVLLSGQVLVELACRKLLVTSDLLVLSLNQFVFEVLVNISLNPKKRSSIRKCVTYHFYWFFD